MTAPLYKRMRALILAFFLQPVTMFAVLGVIIGDLVFWWVLGAVLGVATGAAGSIVWLVGRSELESKGLRW